MAEPGRPDFHGRGPAHGRALLAGRKRPASRWCGWPRSRWREPSDGKPLDIESLTQWLAAPCRAGLFAHRSPQGRRRQGRRHHERRLCRAAPRAAGAGDGAARWWSPRPSPFSPTGWTRSSGSRAARCAGWWPARWTSTATRRNSLRWPSRCVRRRRPAAMPARPASSSWSSWARPTSSWTPTTRAWCRWWIGSGHTPSTSAPATSTWSRGASRA